MRGEPASTESSNINLHSFGADFILFIFIYSITFGRVFYLYGERGGGVDDVTRRDG